MRNLAHGFLTLILIATCATQAMGETTWSKTYGGTGDDLAYSIQEVSSGGYIVAGRTMSFGAGEADFWVIRLNGAGEIEWQKTYGGMYDDFARVVRETFTSQGGDSDGFIVTGNIGITAANRDMWLIKLNPDGTIDWQRTYGGDNGEYAFDAHQVFDAAGEASGFVVGGYTRSNLTNRYDMWGLYLESDGDVLGDLSLSGTGYNEGAVARDNARTITPCYDATTGAHTGYLIAGYKGFINYSVTDPWGYDDLWLVRVALDGTILWEKQIGGADQTDVATCVRLVRNSAGVPDGYVVLGYTSSYGSGGSPIGTDAWVLRVHENGTSTDATIDWQKAYGRSTTDEYAYSIEPTSEGGFIMTCATNWVYGTDPIRDVDVWVVKLAADGTVTWAREYGGDSHDSARAIVPTSDGGYVVAGSTASYGTSVGGTPNLDFWLLKLDAEGNIPGCVGVDITPDIVVTAIDAELVDTEARATLSFDQGQTPEILPADSGADFMPVCEVTLIELESLIADPSDREVTLAWSTASEIHNFAFNVYRANAEDGEYVRINPTLIAAEGSPIIGAYYEFVDEDVKNGRTYWYQLEDIDCNGVATRHGPVSARPGLLYRLGR